MLASSRVAPSTGNGIVRPGDGLEKELTFSSACLEMISGTTSRQIQWWDEHGVVRAERKGYNRLYTLKQATLVMIVSRMRSCGLSLQRIRKLISALSRNPRLVSSLEDEKELLLLIGKRDARFAESNSHAIKTMVCRAEFYIIIAVHELVHALKTCQNPWATRESIR
jgi:DNA-binding transcriptional MerR regulator